MDGAPKVVAEGGWSLMRRVWCVALAAAMLAMPQAVRTQTADEAAAQNSKKARAALEAMVQALGGTMWLNLRNEMRHGHIAAFFHGQPDFGTTEFWQFHEWPDKDRLEFTKHRDVLQFYEGREGWEVTYRGKQALPKDHLDEFLRRRDHSIETAVKVWMKDPKTILIYEGQKLVERHLADQVSLISSQNEAITIAMDAQTHLPLLRSFQWRDPVYKDLNTDTEEYDNYHMVDGLPAPYSITRLKNGEAERQYYIDHVEYNRELPVDFWDVDAWARKIKKKK